MTRRTVCQTCARPLRAGRGPVAPRCLGRDLAPRPLDPLSRLAREPIGANTITGDARRSRTGRTGAGERGSRASSLDAPQSGKRPMITMPLWINMHAGAGAVRASVIEYAGHAYSLCAVEQEAGFQSVPGNVANGRA